MVHKKNSTNLFLAFGLLLVILCVSAYFAGTSLVKGQVVYGSNDLVGWNILIGAYVFLALTASGLCLTSNFFEVLQIHRFQLLQKRAHFLAISLLIPALGALAMELGRIDRVYNFIISPNFSSPMWWMGTVYGIYLMLLIFEFWTIHHGYKKLMRATSIITLIAAVIATSVLGSIFAVILDKPLWFGSGTPVFFVFSSVISGIAAMLLSNVLTYKFSNKIMEEELKQALKELAVILTVFLGIALVFTVWRLITVYYARVPDTSYVINAPYGIPFWLLYLGIGLIVPFILLLNPATRKENGVLAAAGFMVLLGMYVDKHIFVISGQFNQPFSIPTGTYTSTPAEWGIIFGAITVSLLMYIIGERYLSLGTIAEDENIHKLKYSL